MKYFDRIFDEASKEFKRDGIRSLPFIEAIAVMIIVSRGMAEAIEIFPYSIGRFIVDIAYKWISITIPYIDGVYNNLGYPFAPDVSLKPIYPFEKPIYPLCSYMISLWIFSILYTFGYWILFTVISYVIVRLFRGEASYFRLLTWIGISHIPMINWWFYTGCEMMYELVKQEIYMNILPPYTAAIAETRIDTPWGALPSYLPVEGFWAGYGFGVFSLILTTLMIIAFIHRESRLSLKNAFIASIPWIIYLILILYGSLNIDSIIYHLYRYVDEGLGWSWFGK